MYIHDLLILLFFSINLFSLIIIISYLSINFKVRIYMFNFFQLKYLNKLVLCYMNVKSLIYNYFFIIFLSLIKGKNGKKLYNIIFCLKVKNIFHSIN